MKKITFIVLLLSNQLWAQNADWQTLFEKDDNYSATYFEVMDYYKKLAAAYPEIQLKEVGETDSGYPLHTVVI